MRNKNEAQPGINQNDFTHSILFGSNVSVNENKLDVKYANRLIASL